MLNNLLLRTYKRLGSGYAQLYGKTLSLLKENYNVIEDDLLSGGIVDKQIWPSKELWISPIPDGEYLTFAKDKRDKDNLYLLTMWESTVLPRWQRSELAGFKKIFVPSEWNKRCFNEAGFNNVEVVNLFIDKEVFFARPKSEDLNNFIFCTGGTSIRTTGNTERKDINSVIHSFKEEFSNENSVKLYVKLSTDDYYKERKFIDDQIVFFPTFKEESDYASFIGKTDVFVSPSKAEGWGFMQIQSLSVGRKVISPFYSSLTEFLNNANSYRVNFEEKLASSGWGVSGGLWAYADPISLKKQMRKAFLDKKQLRENWLSCSKSVADKFSLLNYKKRLTAALGD